MIKPIAVALILLTPSAYADVDLPAELKDKIEAVGINPVSAEKSPVSGIYSVFSKEGTSYVTSDGEYIFTGNLFKVKGTEVENTTDEFISKGMRSYIEKLDTITYKAPDEKDVIGVFTDITCGFCQKLHSDLQSYLDKGITIKFIAYPRAGMNSMIARNMASVWCADDKPAALTRAMKGDGLPEKQPTKACMDSIQSQFNAGNMFKLSGTPSGLSLKGEPMVFAGLRDPDQMLNSLKTANQKK